MSPIFSPRLGTILTGFLFLAALLQAAVAETEKRLYNIPASDGESALKSFSQQSGKGVIAATDLARGVKTNAINGEFTAAEAIDRMLDGTGLIAREDPKSGSFAVKKDSRPNAPRAAQNTSDRPGNSAKAEEEVVTMGQFEVFGSKLINTDIPRTRDDAQPYVVFSRGQIEQSNATNLDEFFRTRLPMNNTGSITPLNYSGPSTRSSVNLRGLGSNQTLILLDGRRIPSSNVGGAGSGAFQGDINGIPLGMIERIEVLPSTASGIHGGGATGGVINIITRKDYMGVEAAVSYTNTFKTDASLRRLDINGSFHLNGGRTFLSFSSTISDGTSLVAKDRNFVRRARALQLKNNPAAFYAPNVSPASGYTTNIRNSTAANLVLKPQYGGTVLRSPYTHVPIGYAGISSDNAAGLVAAAGSYNLDLPNTTSIGGLTGILSVPSLQSWTVSGRHKFNSRIEAYVDASSLKNVGHSPQSLVSPSTFTLPVTAPNNPFTTPVVVTYPITNISYLSKQRSDSDRIAAGLVLQLPSEWSGGFDYAWSKARYRAENPVLIGDPDGTGPLPSFSSALATGTQDVIRDLNAHPLDYTAYLLPNGVTRFDYGTLSKEGTLRAAGPLWKLPAGDLTLAVSLDWRREEQPSVIFASHLSTGTSTYAWFPEVAVDQGSTYMEARVPVFSEKSNSLLRSLEFQTSVRYDTYRSKGPSRSGGISVPAADGPVPTAPYPYLIRHMDASSAMAGFKYSPVKDIAVRASWGTGFLPPSLSQLGSFLSFNSSGVNVSDPKRGGVQANTGPITLNQGGNPDLKPEDSSSLSYGIILTPRFMPGFRLSVDLTQIHKRDEIASLTLQQNLDYEDLIPWRVVRAPLTPADQALGYTGGRITALSTQSMNLARRKLTAYDFQVDYERVFADWGTFHPYVTASYQPKFSVQVVPNGPFNNTVGYTGPLRWRGNVGLDWKRGRWSAGWNMQYYDSYLGYFAGANASFIATFILNQGTARIPSQSYHDIYASYDFGQQVEGSRRYLNNTRLTVGVQNVFNTEPSILATTSSAQGFSAYGDPRLARYTLTLRKKF